MTHFTPRVLLPLIVLLAFTGCDEGGGENTSSPVPAVPSSYLFSSDSSLSTVAHSGQTARHVLIAQLTAWVGGLTQSIDALDFEPTDPADVVEVAEFYIDFDGASDGDTEVEIAVHPGLGLQESTLGDISTSANLRAKIAGNDSKTDHKDWSSEFSGWGGVTSPDALLDLWLQRLGENAVARAEGELTTDVYLTEDGLDLKQLLQKFLVMAIAFHQGTDDYLDSDVPEKGLLASNIIEEGASYSPLAHAWDEAFGYFGAAKDYGSYTDDEIAAKGGRAEWQGHHDTNGDGQISLHDEYCWGASVNAAKRDRASSELAPTDLTGEIFAAFLAGRALIASVPGELSAAQMAELTAHRDSIVLNWERVYGATVVHYINDVIQDMSRIGTDTYSFSDHAKHWSELKGFSLGFQFNPGSPLTQEDFAAFHAKVGDAPVLEGGDLESYKGALLEARALLGDAYGFSIENLGDDNGEQGW